MQWSTYFFAEVFFQSWGAVITMKNFSAFLDMRRHNNWAHRISSWKYLSKKLFCQFFPEQSASFLLSILSSFQEVLKISSCGSMWFNPCRGRWQGPLCSWQCVESDSEEVAFETQMTLVETWERDIPGAEEALNWYAELSLLLIISWDITASQGALNHRLPFVQCHFSKGVSLVALSSWSVCFPGFDHRRS